MGCQGERGARRKLGYRVQCAGFWGIEFRVSRVSRVSRVCRGLEGV